MLGVVATAVAIKSHHLPRASVALEGAVVARARRALDPETVVSPHLAQRKPVVHLFVSAGHGRGIEEAGG